MGHFHFSILKTKSFHTKQDTASGLRDWLQKHITRQLLKLCLALLLSERPRNSRVGRTEYKMCQTFTRRCFYKDVICPKLPSLLPLTVCRGSNKLAIDVRVCEQVLDSVDWCSHIDAEALGFITVFVRPCSVLQLRYAGLSCKKRSFPNQ